MKILQIVPGTSNFYCGSCIRDTTLVRALRKLGHEVILQPLYLPIFTDEPDIERDHEIFFGGINVYLQQKLDLFQKTPRWIDRLLDSKWLLNMTAKKAGMTKASELGEMTISMYKGKEGRQKKEYERFINWLKENHDPDIALFPNGMLLALALEVKKELNIPVVCTLQGEDGFLDTLPEPYKSECWKLFSELAPQVDALIPVSEYYSSLIRERLNLQSDNYHTIQNGIPLDGYEELNGIPHEQSIGYLARMCEFKGLDTLVDAYIRLRKNNDFPNLKLKIAGTRTEADIPFVEGLQKQLENAGLLNDVEFYPNISRDEKIKFLKSLSVFSVPATYGESFGLFVVEAIAAGVPVVQPDHAGFKEIMSRTKGGLSYEPDNLDAYVSALSDVLRNPQQSRQMAIKGRDIVFEHFNVERMAKDVVSVFEHVLKQ
jgi:glycosyltransferase involved in cell wall biosynthesis